MLPAVTLNTMNTEQPEDMLPENDELGTQDTLKGSKSIDSTTTSVDDSESVESLRDQLNEAEKRVLLCQADLENFRRRKSREWQEQLKFATMPLVNSLLEVQDNLQRALEAAEADDSSKSRSSLQKGVEIVAGQLQNILENNGCKKIETVGHPFDPNLHEAIQTQTSDDVQANHIITEVQTGYVLNDRVVRPSKVIISTGRASN